MQTNEMVAYIVIGFCSVCGKGRARCRKSCRRGRNGSGL